LVRAGKPRQRSLKPLISYDIETTRITAGTPRPLYLTAYSTQVEFHVAIAIRSMAHLRKILEASFLTPSLAGARFVAWNANAFDAYFVAASLLDAPGWVIRPYLTGTGSLRGLLILRESELDDPKARGWEFLDGMAMTGLQGVSLAKFSATFAPGWSKMMGVIDFDKEEFDPKNPQHTAYAARDSEALYYAMQVAQQIMVDHFDQALTPTIGNACVKILKRHIPSGKVIRSLADKPMAIVREQLLRGGFCFCVRRYEGQVWKYDLNQAYASSMRECLLPAGEVHHRLGSLSKYATCYMARIRAYNRSNRIPFYCKVPFKLNVFRAVYALDTIADAWVTSDELEQLKAEDWHIEVIESYFWAEIFTMRDFVDGLEALRTTCAGGPSGPIGTMVKAVGNNAFGKTLERTSPASIVYSAECPVGYMPYALPDEVDAWGVSEHIWFKPQEKEPRDYHQPQLGSFITAHCRMVLRRAILKAPQQWLYADTDALAYSRDMSALLDIDPLRYGAWKCEEDGTPLRIIAKKVLQRLDDSKRTAKGLKVKSLTPEEFQAWYDGKPPVQRQVHRQSFAKVMAGGEMYAEVTRTGSRPAAGGF
jgi:hypothetical protein